MVWKRIHLTEGNTRGENRSTPQSNPRESEGTIMGDMEKILLLIEKNKRIRRGKYE